MFEGIDWSELRHELAERSAASPARSLSQYRIKQYVAAFVLRRCLLNRPFTAADVWAGVPELQSRHKSATIVGSVLRAGINGAGGMNLFEEQDAFAACFENAGLAHVEMVENGELESFLAAESLTDDEFQAQCLKLPAKTQLGEMLRQHLSSVRAVV